MSSKTRLDTTTTTDCLSKVCGKCKVLKPAADFAKKLTKLQAFCKVCCNKERKARYDKNPDCWRDAHLMVRYGITQVDFNAMLEAQDNRCAVCGTADPGGGAHVKRFAVEHCHDTGVIRGLACNPCNTMLGGAKDSIQTLEAGIRYLVLHGSTP